MVLSANSIDSNDVNLVASFIREALLRNYIVGSNLKVKIVLCRTRPPYSPVNAFRICSAVTRRLTLPVFFFVYFLILKIFL